MDTTVTNKRYFSRVPGSAFIFADGTRVLFAHGFLDIDEKIFPGRFNSNTNVNHPDNGKLRAQVYQDELDRLTAEGNPLIFTQETVSKLQDMPKPAQNAQSEASIAAQDQALRQTGRGVETGDKNVGVVIRENESTVDPNLQATLLASRPIGPGAKSVEQLRAEAAARTSPHLPGKK